MIDAPESDVLADLQLVLIEILEDDPDLAAAQAPHLFTDANRTAVLLDWRVREQPAQALIRAF